MTKAHLAIAIELPLQTHNTENLRQATSALNTIFQGDGSPLLLDEGGISLSCLASLDEAKKAAGQDEIRVINPDAATIIDGKCAWVLLTSHDDPSLAQLKHLADDFSPDVVVELLRQMESPVAREAVDVFNSTTLNHSIQKVILDIILTDAKDDISRSLPKEPAAETVSIGYRNDYVKKYEDIDPVESILEGDPYAIENALNEANSDNIAEQDAFAIKQELDEWESKLDETNQNSFLLLGFEPEDVREHLQTWGEGLLSFRGGTQYCEAEGKVAIAASPQLGGIDVHIEFDGITSSRTDAVIDENFLAMLDTLQLDVRGWTSFLAEGADCGKINWDVNLQKIIQDHLPDARKDETGVHWDQVDLYTPLMKEIFPDTENLIDGESTRDYLAPLVFEVLKAQAEKLDNQWKEANGIDINALESFTSSTNQRDAFPQLKDCPNHYMALVNQAPDGCLNYNWKNSPDETPQVSLTTNETLASVLDNSSYSGDFVIAFSCDLDDLKKIGKAMHADHDSEITINGAYMHIHSYSNGAGDGEPLDAPITISAKQLKLTWTVMNDAAHHYGINETFGDFLASSCDIKIKDKIPAVLNEQNALLDATVNREQDDSPAP